MYNKSQMLGYGIQTIQRFATYCCAVNVIRNEFVIDSEFDSDSDFVSDFASVSEIDFVFVFDSDSANV